MAIAFKLFAAGFIFIVGLLSGLLPIISRQTKRSASFLHYGEFFARGIFLSVALIHFLPDAEFSFQQIYPQIHYPMIFGIVVATLFIIQFIEQCASQFALKTAFAQHWMPYLLLILLSIHSIVAGAALGINNNLTHMIIIFIAIISHKSAEAFALSISMRAHKIARHAMIGLILLFSLMTPLGIIASSIVTGLLNHQQATLAQAIFSAIAAGTFFYIASFKTNDLEDSLHQPANILCTLFFGLGITVMALAALYT